MVNCNSPSAEAHLRLEDDAIAVKEERLQGRRGHNLGQCRAVQASSGGVRTCRNVLAVTVRALARARDDRDRADHPLHVTYIGIWRKRC